MRRHYSQQATAVAELPPTYQYSYANTLLSSRAGAGASKPKDKCLLFCSL